MNPSPHPRTLRSAARLLVVLLAAALAVAGLTSPARATVFVSDTPDPSWGVNGTVYTTKVVGDTVFVGGSFTAAVSSTGQSVARKNLAAFSLDTGNLLAGWQADAGSTVRGLASDGTSLYVGGSFAKIGTATQPRLAKLSVATGAVDTTFAPVVDDTVRAIELSGTSAYIGGAFLKVGGVARNRLARVDAGTGALDPTFNASANNIVYTLKKSPVANVLWVGGLLTTLSGTARQGVGAVDATTGALTGPALNSSAKPTYDLDFNDDGTMLYGAGGSGSNTVAAWNVATGARVWRQVSDGDMQALDYYRGTVYFGFHDGFQSNPRIKLLAADAKTGVIDTDFVPQFDAFWGIYSIDISDDGLVVGGDFTTINNVPTGGWARFVRVGVLPAPQPDSVQYLGATTAWRYWDQGGRPSGWETTSFNDAAWPSGTPQLGYGDGDESTTISRGPSATPYTTAYFRSTFTVAGLPSTISLLVLADDGAVVYVNGTEVVRDNMPSGALTESTLASTNRTGGQENAFRPFTFPASLLHTGTNTLAVEVHQSAASSTDASFDIDLSGEVAHAAIQPPTAAFTATVANQSVAFDATGSTDPDGRIVDYAWNFGDGTTGTGATPSHAYTAPGDYTVTLRVTDNDGASNTVARTVTALSPTVTSDVVAKGSAWRWRYATAAPDATWSARTYDASAWSQGAAPLGFGATTIATNINTFASTTDRPKAAYFSRSFEVADAAKVVSLTLSTVADDGVVVYVNGTEVGRSNMPAGTPTINTYASAAQRTTAANNAPITITVPTSLLVAGTNVIAAETHLNYRGTPDVSFDLKATLTANR